MGDCFGLAFYPSGAPENSSPHFKLVSVQLSKAPAHSYSFLVYLSETGNGQQPRMFSVPTIEFTKTDRHLLVIDFIG